MTDVDWEAYTEAIRGLGGVPTLRDARRGEAAEDEAAAVRRARAELASELRQCDEWTQLASRTVATAEAKVVAAQVLLPDPAATARVPDGAPHELADAVRQAEHELDADLAGLEAARRHAAHQADADARAATERAARRRELVKYAVIAAAIALVLLILVVALN